MLSLVVYAINLITDKEMRNTQEVSPTPSYSLSVYLTFQKIKIIKITLFIEIFYYFLRYHIKFSYFFVKNYLYG